MLPARCQKSAWTKAAVTAVHGLGSPATNPHWAARPGGSRTKTKTFRATIPIVTHGQRRTSRSSGPNGKSSIDQPLLGKVRPWDGQTVSVRRAGLELPMTAAV